MFELTAPIIILIVLGVLLLLLAAESPIALALAGSGALGIFLLRNASVATSTIGTTPYSSTAVFGLAVVPMYVLLGMFVLHSGLAERLYQVASRVFRRTRGGLGAATVGASAGFAAVTGSSVAAAATMSRLAIGEMTKHGYPRSFAAGIVAAAGTLGAMIPPSIVLVLYGVVAQESISRLLIAGLLPGILSAISYVLYIGWRASKLTDEATTARLAAQLLGDESPRANASLQEADGAGAKDASDEKTSPPLHGLWSNIRPLLWIGLIFAVVLIGIYSGRFTVIESGALAASIALVMLVIEKGKEGARGVWASLSRSFTDSADVTSMLFALLVGATIFSYFLTLTRAPHLILEWASSVNVAPLTIVLLFLILLIPLGMILEPISIILITVPLMHPVVTGLGFDGIWFAILVVKMIEIGLVTPPIGMTVYIVAGASEATAEETFRGVTPFVVVDLINVGLIVLFPWLALGLASLIS